MIMALTATLFSAEAIGVLHVIYRESYQAGAGALRILSFGMLFFGLIYILTTVISASGRPSVSLLVGVVTLTTTTLLNVFLIPVLGLKGAAISTTISMLVGAVIGSSYLWSKFRTLLPLMTAVRIVACVGVTYAVSLLLIPSSKILVIVNLIILSLIYIIALIVSGELGRADLRLLMRVAGRR